MSHKPRSRSRSNPIHHISLHQCWLSHGHTDSYTRSKKGPGNGFSDQQRGTTNMSCRQTKLLGNNSRTAIHSKEQKNRNRFLFMSDTICVGWAGRKNCDTIWTGRLLVWHDQRNDEGPPLPPVVGRVLSTGVSSSSSSSRNDFAAAELP